MNERNLSTTSLSNNPVPSLNADGYRPPALTVYGSLTALTLSLGATEQPEDEVPIGGGAAGSV